MSDETIEKTYDLEHDTLSGDIRDVLLSHLRDMQVGWQFLDERTQRAKITLASKAASDLVRQVIRIVTTYDHPTVAVDIGKVDFEKELTIKLTAPRYVESIVSLAEHGKAAAVLVLVDPAQFMGERAPAEPDPDQPSLIGED